METEGKAEGTAQGGEGAPKGEDATQKGAAAKAPEAGKAEGAPEGAPEAGGVVDSHGQPGINKERHDREVAALNGKIAELSEKLEAAAKTEKARADLKAEIDKVHGFGAVTFRLVLKLPRR